MNTLVSTLNNNVRTPFISLQDEQALFARYKAGDSRALGEIVDAYIRIGLRHFRMLNRTSPGDAEEYLAELAMGICVSAVKFEPERGLRFGTYIWNLPKQVIGIFLQNNTLIRAPQTSSARRYFAHRDRYLRMIDEAPTRLEGVKAAAEDLQITPDVLEGYETAWGGRRPSSLDAPLSYNGGGSISEVISDGQATPEDTLIETDLHSRRIYALHSEIDKLAPRDKDIIIRRVLTDPPQTLEEVGNIYGVTRERIRQIEHRALTRVTASIQRSPLMRHA